MIVFFVSFLLIDVAAACSTPGYDVLYRGQCFKPANINTLMHDSNIALRKECAEDEAFPPIFEMETDLALFNRTASSLTNVHLWILCGLTCDLSNGKYTWLNGAPLTYFNHFNGAHPSSCTMEQTYFMFSSENLLFDFTYITYTNQNFCQKPAFVDPYCGNFDKFALHAYSSTCVKFSTKPMNWNDAQAYCKARGSHLAGIHSKQVNDYIRRSAVAVGLKDGVFIGLSSGFGSFGWVDGSPMDYTNFENGYPNALSGNCGMMSVALGQWVNVDCNIVSPFACTKPPLIERQIPNSCADRKYESGDHLYSPGFPESANVLCDYFLQAPAGKIVELEIVFLEANRCCDALILEDNTIGGNLIANLTGYSTEHKVYRSSTPLMWVHWRPANGEGIRGFHAIFRVADP